MGVEDAVGVVAPLDVDEAIPDPVRERLAHGALGVQRVDVDAAGGEPLGRIPRAPDPGGGVVDRVVARAADDPGQRPCAAVAERGLALADAVWERLVAIKRRYDPDGVLSGNGIG